MVTTGSIMNTRVYGGGSGASNKSGGVKRNALLQTRIQLADRNKPTGRASFTSMSRSINGRAVIVNTGNAGCCNGTQKMSTMEKIAMWNAIAQSSLALAKGIGDLVGAGKTDKTKKSSDIETLNKVNNSGNADGTTGAGNSNATGNAALAATLDALGFADIPLDNIDYKQIASNFISQMDNANNSQDLYQALQGAKAYKQQVATRMSGINIENLRSSLQTLEGEAKGSIKEAKGNLESADKGVKSAEDKVNQGERQVDSARQSYDSARADLAKNNEKFKTASENVDAKTKSYDQAMKNLADGRDKYNLAKIATSECTQAWETAKTNTSQALANLNSLKAQQGFGTDGAALQAQIAEAQTKYDTALEAEKAAEKAKEDAVKAEGEAKTNMESLELSCESSRKEVVGARNSLREVAQNMKTSDKITKDQLELLENRQKSLELSEYTLQSNKETLQEAKETQADAQARLDKLENEKNELEVQIHDYKEMEDASKKLGDLSKFDKKLEDMMTKEGTTREALTTQLNTRDYQSNTADSPKGKVKAEKKETKLTNKLVDLNAGDATDDIARDKKLQISNRLDQMANMTQMAGVQNFGSFGASNKTTLNGHTVEYKDGKYFIDGGSTGMDKASAQMMINTKAFNANIPKFDFS